MIIILARPIFPFHGRWWTAIRTPCRCQFDGDDITVDDAVHLRSGHALPEECAPSLHAKVPRYARLLIRHTRRFHKPECDDLNAPGMRALRLAACGKQVWESVLAWRERHSFRPTSNTRHITHAHSRQAHFYRRYAQRHFSNFSSPITFILIASPQVIH